MTDRRAGIAIVSSPAAPWPASAPPTSVAVASSSTGSASGRVNWGGPDAHGDAASTPRPRPTGCYLNQPNVAFGMGSSGGAETPTVVAAYIAELVEAAPPLTTGQRDRLAVLLRPVPHDPALRAPLRRIGRLCLAGVLGRLGEGLPAPCRSSPCPLRTSTSPWPGRSSRRPLGGRRDGAGRPVPPPFQKARPRWRRSLPGCREGARHLEHHSRGELARAARDEVRIDRARGVAAGAPRRQPARRSW